MNPFDHFLKSKTARIPSILKGIKRLNFFIKKTPKFQWVIQSTIPFNFIRLCHVCVCFCIPLFFLNIQLEFIPTKLLFVKGETNIGCSWILHYLWELHKWLTWACANVGHFELTIVWKPLFWSLFLPLLFPMLDPPRWIVRLRNWFTH